MVLAFDVKVNQRVDGLIQAYPIMMFSKSTCKHCISAKRLLEQKRMAYRYLDLDKDPQHQAIFQILKMRTNQTTVPNIFMNGQHVGGAEALRKRLQ